MAEQIIDVGTAPNSGTGDPLRTAFIKTDNNFDQIWAAGPVGSNVRIQGNVISTLQVNQDLALSPNGVGNVRLNNNTIPGANNTWFLGSVTNRWRGLFVGNVTAGNITINDGLTVPGDAYIGGNLTVVGNTIQIGNITTDTKTIQLANTATTDSAANGSGITVGANDDIATFLYDSANNVWTTNIGVSVGGPITGTSLAVSDATIYGNIAAVNGNFTGNVTANYFIGDGSQLTNIIGATISNTAPAIGNGAIWWNSVDGRAYVKYNSQFIDLSPSLVPDPTTYVGNVVFDDLTIENVGNILPATTNVYSLGSAGFQWKDLWVSNSTIYMNSVPIGLTSANVLTVNGEPILSNNSTTSITTTGNITADYLFGNGSQLTGLNTNRILNGTSNVEIATADGNVNVTANGSATWNFATDGNLVTPANLVIGPSPAGGSSILQYDSALQVVGEGANAIMVMGWAANTNAPDSIAVVGFNTPYTNGASNVLIAVGNNATVVNYWNFDNTGVLTIPGNINYSGDASASPSLNDFFSITSAVDFAIVADSANTTPTWTFDATGNLTYPDGTVNTGGAVYAAANALVQMISNNENTQVRVDDANVEIYTSPNGVTQYQWTFDTTGNLTLPNSGYLVVTTGIVGSGASPAPSINGFSDASFIGNVTANYFIGNGSELTSVNAVTVDVTDTNGLGTTYYPTFIENRTTEQIVRADVDLSYRTDTNTLSVGNISASGNVSGNYVLGNGAFLTGVATSYGNANVANFLANYGSNTIVTTGNVTANNFIGNISITGNVTGTSANVDIVAGVYQWTFNNAGNLVLPGNTFSVNYANGTAVSLGGGSSYGDSNVVTLMSAFGSNTVVTTGNITAGNINATGNVVSSNLVTTGNVVGNVEGFAIGYRDIPQLSLAANTTIATTDAGKHYYSTSASALTLTIANNASQAFQVGATINIINQGAGNVSVLRGVGVTLYLAGNSTSSDRTLTSYGVASVTKVSSDTWFIAGVGLV